ncbi:anthranilate phosphoribosyltransferase [Hoeflea sp. AS60]|uniref:anthranilate phosphoribosyltransferase n=1 Tax=Hoeflea sp. AS60 TaxID=3135780 RepID=UPI0031825E4F
MADLKSFIAKVANGEPLDRTEARSAFGVMMSGDATPSQIGGFLMALRVRGESVDELYGAVSVMREKMLPVNAPADAVDIVGTGGDASGTYNVSTAAAFIVAGTGVKVAKHGNRALSSKSGAADSLAALGVSLELDPKGIAACIEQAGVGFMFAPAHHSAMRHVGPSRVELGTRTIFNLLGPLSNPAGVKKQLLGVFSAHWLDPLAQVMRDLGSETVWVVHGDGLDEMTTTGVTQVFALENGQIRSFEITPEEIGLPRVSLDQLKGGDGVYNAAALKKVLEGEKNAYRDIAVLNAAGALVIAGKAAELRDAIGIAEQSIDSGGALATLNALVSVSQAHAPAPKAV